MATTFQQPGRIITLTATAAQSSDDVVVIGDIVGVVQVDALINAEMEVSIAGVHTLASQAVLAYTEGQPLYWDAANSVLTGTPTALTVYAGPCVDVGGKAGATATTQVLLNGSLGGALANSGTDWERLSVAVAPNVTIVEPSLSPPYATRFIGCDVFIDVAAVSALGTYTLAISGAGNNLLSAATYDMETLVVDTVTAMALTATAADLLLPASSIMRFTLVSNNADLVGDGLIIVPQYAAV